MTELCKFYRDRITACPKYGFKAGQEILALIEKTAFWDSYLTDEEYNNIMILCHMVRIKILEDDYNAGWQDK